MTGLVVVTPLGAAAAAEGETSALAPLVFEAGGIVEPPFKCGGCGCGWDGWVIKLWVCGWTVVGVGSCARSRSG
jgi:hypothetical protein